MKVPEAGWLSLGHDQQPLVFVPLKRYQKRSFPGMLPVILGTRTPAKIAVRHFPPKNSSALYTPARVKQISEEKYQMGPFIGILTTDGGNPFGGNHKNFADLIRTGRNMGVTVFVLTPKSLLSDDSTIPGYLLDHRSGAIRWLPAKLPIPDVVYNRIPNRKSEQKREVQAAIHKLRNHFKVHFFNPGFFDKWTIYQHLLSSEELKSFVPETARFDSPRVLKRMLAKYPFLYLKPVDGKAGIGIMRVSAQHQKYEVIHQSMRQKKKYLSSTSDSLCSTIQKLCQKRSYVLQQGIPLATYRDRPFDVRMLLQKDGNGRWGLTGAGIRVAGETAISTHVPMGGRIENIHTVFNEVFGEKQKEVYRRAEEVGLSIARFIESKQPSKLGEMSIDLGVEPNGRMWFFEANAKPMKFDEPEIRERSLRRLIQYSLYLSGYNPALRGIGS